MTTPGSADAPVARRRLVAAALVALAAWVPAAAAVALTVVFALPLAGPRGFVSLYLIDAVVWGAVSALLVARRPNPVGAVLAVTAVGSALSALGAQVALSPFGGILGSGVAAHVVGLLWLPGTLLSLSVLPLLLTSRPLRRTEQTLVGAGVVAAVLSVAGLLAVALAVSVVLAIVTAVVLLRRWRSGPIDERRGAGWLALGQLLLLVFVGPTLLPVPTGATEVIIRFLPLAPFAAIVFMAVAVVVAALGSGLWGIESAVNRVLVDVLLLVLLVMLYVSVALPASTALPVPPTIAGAAGVAALALALAPARRWLQRRVDALVYGDAAEPAQLLARIGRHPGGAEQGLGSLVAELRDALRLGRLEVRAVETGGPVVVAGAPGYAAPTVLPLRTGRRTAGWVHAGSTSGHRVDRRTRYVLERISGVLVIALQLETVNRDLDEARVRLLSVGAEERRMVRHDLRDGLAPALAASADRLGAVATRLDGGTRVGVGDVREEVRAVRGEIAARTTEVRDLARTLLPGALDAGDVDTALTELASRFSGERLDITAVSNGTRDLDPARQAALHHLAAEAVLLIRRASGVRRAELRVDVGTDDIRVVAGADAPFALGPSAAPTLASLSDRAEELGGTLVVHPAGDALDVTVPR